MKQFIDIKYRHIIPTVSIAGAFKSISGTVATAMAADKATRTDFIFNIIFYEILNVKKIHYDLSGACDLRFLKTVITPYNDVMMFFVCAYSIITMV